MDTSYVLKVNAADQVPGPTETPFTSQLMSRLNDILDSLNGANASLGMLEDRIFGALAQKGDGTQPAPAQPSGVVFDVFSMLNSLQDRASSAQSIASRLNSRI